MTMNELFLLTLILFFIFLPLLVKWLLGRSADAAKFAEADRRQPRFF